MACKWSTWIFQISSLVINNDAKRLGKYFFDRTFFRCVELFFQKTFWPKTFSRRYFDRRHFLENISTGRPLHSGTPCTHNLRPYYNNTRTHTHTHAQYCTFVLSVFSKNPHSRLWRRACYWKDSKRVILHSSNLRAQILTDKSAFDIDRTDFEFNYQPRKTHRGTGRPRKFCNWFFKRKKKNPGSISRE